MTQSPSTTPSLDLALARTPLDHWHTRHGAHFACRDGWHVPAVYTTVEREIAAARAGLALTDISAFAKFSLRGPGVDKLIKDQAGDSPARELFGVYVFTTNGTVLACRLAEDHLLLLTSATYPVDIENRLTRLSSKRPLVKTDVTSAYASFCLLGPRTEEVLRRVTDLDVSKAAFPDTTCAETLVAGVPALLVRQTNQSFPAMRVYVSWDRGEYVWEALLGAVRNYGVAIVGLDCWQRLLGMD